ncbi:hypothetical protein DL93DRAFT_2174424 [Clavulina sp. PMI_390]|nr:hypothetical protein DL93DRAFT_2174424 [Clavulina sp. PMI_390]
MIVQQSLWDAAQGTINDLSSSINSALRDPSFSQAQHVLTLTPSRRERASAAIKDRKDQVSDYKHRLEVARSSLTELETLCASVLNILDMCLHPIGALPQELVQHIAHFTVESPRSARQIMTLSQVCQTWRAAIFTMPKLFVSPDRGWAPDVLNLWLARAGTRVPHSRISVTDSESQDIVDKVSQAITPYLQRVQTLHVEVHGYTHDSSFPSSFSEIFRSHPLPLLESPIITDQGSGAIVLNSDQAPRLRTLYSSGRPIALLSGGKLALRSLGWRVKSLEDIKTLATAAASQTNPFHLTIYAHLDNWA